LVEPVWNQILRAWVLLDDKGSFVTVV